MYGNIKLTWTPPTQRVDGTALPAGEILLYQIFRSTNPGGPFSLVASTPDNNPEINVTMTTPGTYYFNIKTNDTGDRISAASVNMQVQITAPPPALPNPPTNLQAQQL